MADSFSTSGLKPDLAAGEAVIRRISQRPSEEARREYPRFAVELEVSLGSEHNFYSGLVENLSVGGVFIATHVSKPVGSLVEVSLRLPGSEDSYAMTGEVRWVRPYSEEGGMPPGLGVRFLSLPAGAEQLIARFLAQREPLFFDED
ncbi:MAG TPA: TIGR02266 family protein [Polyangiaceae bacterium]|jgi:type IV pilus assembly protein PilZ